MLIQAVLLLKHILKIKQFVTKGFLFQTILHSIFLLSAIIFIYCSCWFTKPEIQLLTKPLPIWICMAIVISDFVVLNKSTKRHKHETLHAAFLILGLIMASLGDISLNIHDIVKNSSEYNSVDISTGIKSNLIPTAIVDSLKKHGQAFFLLGVACFLLCHICYVIAFSIEGRLVAASKGSSETSSDQDLSFKIEPTITFKKALKTRRGTFMFLLGIGFSLGTFLFLSQKLPNGLMIPVLVYLSIISLCSWRMSTRVNQSTIIVLLEAEIIESMIQQAKVWERKYQLMRFLGALIFVFSDIFISLTSFGFLQIERGLSTTIIMSTYYLAQYIITISCREYKLITKTLTQHKLL